jgi:hypothetical protein
MMQAKTVCPTHGRLEIDQIVIKNGIPVCGKCSSELQFGVVRPRFDVNGNATSSSGSGKKKKK